MDSMDYCMPVENENRCLSLSDPNCKCNDKLICYRALRVRKKMTAPGDDVAIIGDILCENVSVLPTAQMPRLLFNNL